MDREGKVSTTLPETATDYGVALSLNKNHWNAPHVQGGVGSSFQSLPDFAPEGPYNCAAAIRLVDQTYNTQFFLNAQTPLRE